MSLSDAALSRLGLGASRVGSFNNPQTLAEARALIRYALELGVTVIDTSNVYGQGDSEAEIGRALTDRRDTAFVVTKTGKRFSAKMRLLRPLKPLLRPLLGARAARSGRGPAPASAVTARRGAEMREEWRPEAFGPSLDASLRRLRTDRVDGFLLHSPPAEVVARAETGAALAALKQTGKVVHYGVSCDDAACFRAALRMDGLTLLQLPWEVIAAADEATIRDVRAKGVIVLAREVIRQQPGVPAAAAVAQAAVHPLVDTVLVGTTSREHLAALATAR